MILVGSLRKLATISLAGAAVWLLGPAAIAATPDLHYPSYAAITVDDGTGENSTTASFPGGVTPDAAVSSNRPLTLASSATLGASTPFGAVFGSSAGKSYLRVDVKASTATITTITFADELQANELGIALGDIDAEQVVITMSDKGGAALSATQMGAQDPFNYAGADDLPSITVGDDALTVADTRCVDEGQTCDTNGATAWLQPTVPLKTITLTATKVSGLPEYQLWLAHTDYQVVTWDPTTALSLANLPAPPDQLATTSGDGAVSYAVADPGQTGCSVNPSTAEISATSAGTCAITATAARTDDYLQGSRTVRFIIDTKDDQIVTWSPTTSLTLEPDTTTFAPDDLPTASDNGPISYAVADSGTASCQVGSSSGLVTFASAGSCQITASAAGTTDYGAGSTTVTFQISFRSPSNHDSGSDPESKVVVAAEPTPELAPTGAGPITGAWLALLALVVGVATMAAGRARQESSG